MTPYELTHVTYNPHRREMAAAVACALPHLAWRRHGIGVLQAYLVETDPEVRVHIWHPSLVCEDISDSGQIHDHRFDMVSHVLVGTLQHDEFHVNVPSTPIEGGWRQYQVVHARAGKKEKPELVSCDWDARVIEGEIYAGSTYTFPKGEFHRTTARDYAVTLVVKKNQEDRQARILGRKGKPLILNPVVDGPAGAGSFAYHITAAMRLLMQP